MKSGKTIRNLLLLCLPGLVLLLEACANPAPPPGGPSDEIPPEILQVDPPTKTLNFRGESIRIEFSEWLRREGFAESVYITPPAEFELSWSGSELELEFTDTLADNTTYALSLGTDYTDLKGNKPAQAYTLIFSTGSRLDSGVIRGKVHDRAPAGVFVFLYPLDGIDPDTLNPAHTSPKYRTQVGTNGMFELQALPAGAYRLMAVRDEFRNQLYDVGEDAFGAPPADLQLEEGGKVETRLRIGAAEDLSAPVFYSARALFARRLSLKFNEVLDERSVRASAFSLSDSAGVEAAPSIIAAHRAAGDSLAADVYLADTLTPDLRWRITALSLSDSAGNRLADTANSVFFSAVDRRDTLPPVLERPPFSRDSSRDVDTDTRISLLFSGAVDTLAAMQAVRLQDAAGADVALDFDWLGSNHFTFRSREELAPDTWYTLTVRRGGIRGIFGTPLPDSSLRYSFLTFDTRNFGGLRGTLIDTASRGGPYVLLAESPDGALSYKANLAAPGEWEISDVKAGRYMISVFEDTNSNGRYDYGTAYPFTGGERFTVLQSEIRVARRFSTQDIRVEFR